MTTSTVETRWVAATQVVVTDDTISVDLSDGRTIAAPLAWFPRLLHGMPDERSHWRLIGQGRGIHWPDLDEDISVENLLAGKPSAESQRSLKAWLAKRANPAPLRTRNHEGGSVEAPPPGGAHGG